MSEVKRYDAGCDYAGEDEMVQNQFGDYVTFEDYAALKAERDALSAQNAELSSDCRHVQNENRNLAAENSALIAGYEKVTDELSSIYHSDGWSVSEDGESDTAVIEFDGALSVVADVRSEIKTPTTDAFLLNVQADGVKAFSECAFTLEHHDHALSFAANLRAQAESLKGGECSSSEVKLIKCAAARDGECNHKQCPQIRDNEPQTTGRHCPIDNWEDEL